MYYATVTVTITTSVSNVKVYFWFFEMSFGHATTYTTNHSKKVLVSNP